MSIPCLFTTFGRLAYTKQALEALTNVRGISIFIIDNNSTDGTREWLLSQPKRLFWRMHFFKQNYGITGAFNLFLNLTKSAEYIMKADNDTIIPPDFIAKMIPHMAKADLVQAKHPILKATHPKGFDDWVSTMPTIGPNLKGNHFCGGSGILMRRSVIDKIPETEWKLGGFRQWQAEHPEVRKGFALNCEIKLLDTNEAGANYPKEYENYYRLNQRL